MFNFNSFICSLVIDTTATCRRCFLEKIFTLQYIIVHTECRCYMQSCVFFYLVLHAVDSWRLFSCFRIQSKRTYFYYKTAMTTFCGNSISHKFQYFCIFYVDKYHSFPYDFTADV